MTSYECDACGVSGISAGLVDELRHYADEVRYDYNPLDDAFEPDERLSELCGQVADMLERRTDAPEGEAVDMLRKYVEERESANGKAGTRGKRLLQIVDMVERDYARRDAVNAEIAKLIAERDEWKANAKTFAGYSKHWRERCAKLEYRSDKRAAAVERLRMLDEFGGGSFEYAILGSDKIAWRYMDKRDALIDLLTDDDSTTQEDDSTTELVSDEADSREKLEADVLEMVKKGFITYETLIEWLDRQAAITESECLVKSVQGADAILIAECAELQAQVNELKERADYNIHGWAKANIGWAEANAEVEKWQMKCDEFRSKFGKCIDYADAIHALMDDEGVA